MVKIAIELVSLLCWIARQAKRKDMKNGVILAFCNCLKQPGDPPELGSVLPNQSDPQTAQSLSGHD